MSDLTYHTTITRQGVTLEADVPKGYRLISEEELTRLEAAARLLSDLDRCQHGRHEQDGCYGCQNLGHAFNEGNPTLITGACIGFDISGRPYVVPPPAERGNPATWSQR